MNKLIKPIEKFFDRIANLKGTLLHIENALTNHSKIIQEQIEKSKNQVPDFALGSKLVIADLTGITDNGWEYYYPTTGKHIVKLSNYDEEVNKLIKRETGYSLAQGYEAFSTYLKDILAYYFEKNQDEAKILKVVNKCENLSNIVWIDKMREISTGKNNKELFKLIRRIRNDFKYSETNNNKNINLRDWYLVYSLVRHKITHSSGKLLKDEKLYKSLNSNQKGYIKTFFPYQETGDYLFFDIPRKIGDKVLDILSEYAFLIFKELSIKSNYDWKILKNMK